MKLNGITMTGRFCYVFMCLEKYLMTVYPHVDWTPIASKMWQWTNHWWNESWDTYSQIVPEYILQYASFEDAYKDYDGKLDENDYYAIISCYYGITTGEPSDEICRALHTPIEMGSLCEGAAFSWAEPLVQELIDELERILIFHNIELPDAEMLNHYRYDINKKVSIDEPNPAWGPFEDSECLSVILNQNRK